MGRGEKKKLVPELTLLEPGIWSARPAEVWALEDKLTEKQQHPFRLRASDEDRARAALLSSRPALATLRQQAEARLQPEPDLFAALRAGDASP